MRLISSTHNQCVPLPVPATHTRLNSPPLPQWSVVPRTHTSSKIWVFQASLLIHKTLSTGVADDLLYMIFCLALIRCCCCFCYYLLLSFMGHASPCALRQQLVLSKPKQIEIFFKMQSKNKAQGQTNKPTNTPHTHTHRSTHIHAYVPIIRYLWGVSKSRLINFFKSFNK